MKKEKTEMIEYTLKNNDFRLSKPLFDTFLAVSINDSNRYPRKSGSISL